MREFGQTKVRMIDPACGSGHFLLGGFARVLAAWQREAPDMPPAAQAQQALDAVSGVDLNPFAVEIARFRLLLAALKAAEVTRLAAAPAFRFSLAVGDSLLHGRHFGRQRDFALEADEGFRRTLRHHYVAEDTAMLDAILGRRGDQATERAGFAAHPGLVAASRAGRPPRLFHKADLGPSPELPATVGDALADPQQRVVGVVHNSVDAQLAGSDQMELTWSADVLRPLPALLRIARDAGRVVVVTGDHGHVVEDSSGYPASSVAQRWRAAGPAGEGEISLSGGRVLSPEGAKSIVAAWSERMRYASTRVGSHGGASPQEVLIPVAVLSAGWDRSPAGWREAPPPEPAWWRGSTELLPAGRPAVLPATVPASCPPPAGGHAGNRNSL